MFIVTGLGGQGGTKRPNLGPRDRGLGGTLAGVSGSAGLELPPRVRVMGWVPRAPRVRASVRRAPGTGYGAFCRALPAVPRRPEGVLGWELALVQSLVPIGQDWGQAPIWGALEGGPPEIPPGAGARGPGRAVLRRFKAPLGRPPLIKPRQYHPRPCSSLGFPIPPPHNGAQCHRASAPVWGAFGPDTATQGPPRVDGTFLGAYGTPRVRFGGSPHLGPPGT